MRSIEYNIKEDKLLDTADGNDTNNASPEATLGLLDHESTRIVVRSRGISVVLLLLLL